ncbi:ABC transporter ATP-binding protein [Hyphobacterium sp.]|uniref:ABC transporter ATP-binding protein n=1 Tax=Hyphobacterium sp. TaxID=2004662 RepID=UPI003B5255E4
MSSVKIEDLGMRYRVYENVASVESPDGAGDFSPRGQSNRWVQALSNINLELAEGERLGIIGRNGCGKSTLLKIIAGLLPPSEGQVQIDGQVSSLIDIAHGMRIEATGERNILLRGMIAGLTMREARARIDDIAAFAELGDYIKLPVRTYSSGMAMRLNFAIATAFDPDILIVDEWIGAGDRAFQQRARARMQELIEASGALILASHDLELVGRMADRVLWLDSGHMKALGPAADVIERYREAVDG